MAKYKLVLPKMGESVAEATITTWLKEVGDTIEADETVLEVATDKVDSEVPCEVDGVLVEKFFGPNDVVKVGEVLAIIETDEEGVFDVESTNENEDVEEEQESAVVEELEASISAVKEVVAPTVDFAGTDRFYSPLVKNIAKEENVSLAELETIKGSGKGGRVTKSDMLAYLQQRTNGAVITETMEPVKAPVVKKPTYQKAAPVSVNGKEEIIEMTRMGKLISHHMKESVQTSVHVQSHIEVDVTNIWDWRNKIKAGFEIREGEKLTFTPIFMEAVAAALRQYPMLNISLDEDKIVKHKDINLGMAAALPDGNLIVPVIKNADQLNLVGMAKVVNDLANRARLNQLKPDEIKGGTYTVTNIGMFGSVMGTPIINQPQVGILALGAIRKVPAVIETPQGDFIGIRMKMFLSHSYDHRVVNGALGGMFVKAVADYLEAWDVNREV
ncbi:dihydrolipoamide acetyltransferase component of pyruvate dehydrogenase complex [Neptunitalea chrysea]|uniref:Dihydrolipoamide acetyltransferase component of pyruvate dehydrogenase complex n=1 Tax=Neptunitalea chrysea TaxID=1647581 RepID=A0A9W6B8A6_9FLAO|nr:dihydrolipoamide acetyltransferase family protein [Neptunitalea chrysea]GLB53204.1 dihydrolipoamide acetyltransferase component of pyruvate dehydrogenase complex [Neptunitalea chrysea]